MKNLVLVVPTSIYPAVIDELRALDVPGFSVCHVEGHGSHTAQDGVLSAQDRVVGFVPRVRIDMVLDGEAIESLLTTLTRAGSVLSGQGYWWVAPVERAGRF